MEVLTIKKWLPTKRKSQRGTWILPSEGTKHSLHIKDRSRSKIMLFHAKIIVCRSFYLVVYTQGEHGENRGLADFRSEL